LKESIRITDTIESSLDQQYACTPRTPTRAHAHTQWNQTFYLLNNMNREMKELGVNACTKKYLST